MRLTQNFTLRELAGSYTAERMGIDITRRNGWSWPATARRTAC